MTTFIKHRSLCAIWVGCPLNQGVWRHWHGIQVRYKGTSHWTWPTLELFLLSRFAPMGYGYNCPSDLRLPQWLASNSLHLGTELSEFLIQWWKAAGCSQVLDLSVRVSRWDWPLQFRSCVQSYFNFSKTLTRVVLVRSHRTIWVKHDSDDLIRVDSLTWVVLNTGVKRDELYSNHIHVGFEYCDCDYSTYPIVGYHC